jgi:ribosomal protein S18 acetylase RimI-like enzyme
MLEVRDARPGEIGFLRALDPMAIAGSERHGQIAMWVTRGTCRVAVRDGDIAGYLVSDHSFFHQRFIELVLVAKVYRRQGIGHALVQDALDRTPTEKVWTSTNKSNASMQALLAKLGFTRSGQVDNLDPGDPELIFVRLPSA